MPASAADQETVPGQALAIAAETLYLVNLMAAPGLAFLVLAWLWWRQREGAPALACGHLNQAFLVSLWGGMLMVFASGAILFLGGLNWAWTWVAVIIYFTCIHSTLIVFGCVGLARAMAGKPFRYPLIGVSDD